MYRDIIEVFIEVLRYFDKNIHDVDRCIYWFRRRGGKWDLDEEYLSSATVRLCLFAGELSVMVTDKDGVQWRVATEQTTAEETQRTLAVRFPHKDVI